jgi:hypothetical protein
MAARPAAAAAALEVDMEEEVGGKAADYRANRKAAAIR